MMQTVLLKFLLLLLCFQENQPVKDEVPFSNSVEIVGIDQAPASPYCGIYALIGALKAEGLDSNFQSIFSGRYVPSHQGSSVLDLIAAGKEQGADCRVFQNLTIESLQTSRVPLLLHLNRSLDQTASRHWVLYLGDEEGRARLVDAPNALELVDYATILAEWDNVAVSVSATSQSPLSIGYLYLQQFLLVSVLLIGCGVFHTALTRVRVTGLMWQAGLVVVVSMITGWVYHSFWVAGLMSNPQAVALVDTRHFRDNLPTIRWEEIEQIASNDGKLQMIDARMPASFRMGSLPEAINLPVNVSHSQFHEIADQLDPNLATVVFCQSEDCPWGEVIAKRLFSNGFDNVKIFRGGYLEYCQRRYRIP